MIKVYAFILKSEVHVYKILFITVNFGHRMCILALLISLKKKLLILKQGIKHLNFNKNVRFETKRSNLSARIESLNSPETVSFECNGLSDP